MANTTEIIVSVRSDDFDIGEETAKLGEIRDSGGDPEAGLPGAVATFTGLVRDNGNKIKAITLEHYEGMTEAELDRIARLAAERWELSGITIIHRIGRLEAGARIVFVGCASRHRKAAFEATEFIMDFLKTDAPFWKSEETKDGKTEWVSADEKDTAAAERWKD